jgi:hypothetical protein
MTVDSGTWTPRSIDDDVHDFRSRGSRPLRGMARSLEGRRADRFEGSPSVSERVPLHTVAVPPIHRSDRPASFSRTEGTCRDDRTIRRRGCSDPPRGGLGIADGDPRNRLVRPCERSRAVLRSPEVDASKRRAAPSDLATTLRRAPSARKHWRFAGRQENRPSPSANGSLAYPVLCESARRSTVLPLGSRSPNRK